ncbi:MAG TPA: D-alanyl-D-alanine carboxypeptidase family protein [Candidatus Sulfotelmatobacter sp.]|nr:D-alanyl-D-alanine carboxypeptidase family protein [Candidatus Sulfotelmatobacter sp.]
MIQPIRPPSLVLRSVVVALLAIGFAATAATAAPKHKPTAPPPAAAAAPAPSTPPPAEPAFPTIETAAQYAYIIDANTGAVLLDKGGEERMFPSSMTKMMTAYIIFDKLEKGELHLDDTFAVSEDAWRRGGAKSDSSTMYLELGSHPSVEQLIQGMIVQSGNDACIVLAEGLSGSESAFAEEMNRWARKMGLTGTNFANATGYPDPNNYSTARDLAILAKRSIDDHPDYYKYYAEKEYTYNGIRQGNRNPLLYKNLGVDGLKTGHTEIAGFGLAVSAVREGGRRIIMVLNGMTSIKMRSQESEKLLDWAYREFEDYTLFKAGDTVDNADVWLGNAKTVPLVAEAALTVTLPRKSRHDMKVTEAYDSPINAPIHKGDRLAKLTITAPGIDPVDLPLVAGADVTRLNAFGRLGAAVSYLMFGK